MSALVFSVNIHDQATYAEYRRRIAPVMERHGVTIRAEFEVGSTISSVSDDGRANRLAVFLFPTDAAQDAFFEDPAYVAAKPLLLASTDNVQRLVP